MTKLTTFTSIAALAAAFAVTPAMAQDASLTIDGTVVSDSDLPLVQSRCEALKLEHDTSLSTQSEDTDVDSDLSTDTDTSTDTGDDDATAMDSDDDSSSGGDNALTSVDLDALTYEQCETGGFYEDATM